MSMFMSADTKPQNPKQLLRQQITTTFMGPLDVLNGISQTLAVQHPAESSALQERNRILIELADLQAKLALPLTQALLLTERMVTTHPDIITAQIFPPQEGSVATGVLVPTQPERSPLSPPLPLSSPTTGLTLKELRAMIPAAAGMSNATFGTKISASLGRQDLPPLSQFRVGERRFSIPPEVARKIADDPNLLQKRPTGRPRGSKKK